MKFHPHILGSAWDWLGKRNWGKTNQKTCCTLPVCCMVVAGGRIFPADEVKVHDRVPKPSVAPAPSHSTQPDSLQLELCPSTLIPAPGEHLPKHVVWASSRRSQWGRGKQILKKHRLVLRCSGCSRRNGSGIRSKSSSVGTYSPRGWAFFKTADDFWKPGIPCESLVHTHKVHPKLSFVISLLRRCAHLFHGEREGGCSSELKLVMVVSVCYLQKSTENWRHSKNSPKATENNPCLNSQPHFLPHCPAPLPTSWLFLIKTLSATWKMGNDAVQGPESKLNVEH